jgi:hypothetical protein
MEAAGRIRALTALLIAGAMTVGAHTLDDGRSDRDRVTERFLEQARVVAREPVGEGITRPLRLTLALAGETRHAIFKTIDERRGGPTLDLDSHRIVTDFSDSWRYEVAAYRLDRAVGFGLVPVTVERRVDGVQGSLQEWVEECGTFRRLVDSGHLEIRGDGELLLRRLTWMYVLDELIANADRNYDNILVDPRTDRFALIDHSRAFRLRHEVAPPTLPEPRPLSARIADRIRRLDRSAIEGLVGDLLTSPQIDALANRRDALLGVLEARGLLPPPD